MVTSPALTSAPAGRTTTPATASAASPTARDAWLVTLDGVVIGDCGTHGPADENGDIELGYGLAAPFRGRGFGNEMAIGLTEHLRRLPGVRRVVANEVLADNVPSRRALERAGFTCVRETDDLCWYALAA